MTSARVLAANQSQPGNLGPGRKAGFATLIRRYCRHNCLPQIVEIMLESQCNSSQPIASERNPRRLREWPHNDPCAARVCSYPAQAQRPEELAAE